MDVLHVKSVRLGNCAIYDRSVVFSSLTAASTGVKYAIVGTQWLFRQNEAATLHAAPLC
jgi:hypothetical protein